MIAYAADGAQYGLGFGLAYFHLGSGVAVALGLTLVVFTLSGGRYWRWERIALGLAAFDGLLAAIMVRPHAGAVVSSRDFLSILGGNVSTVLAAIFGSGR